MDKSAQFDRAVTFRIPPIEGGQNMTAWRQAVLDAAKAAFDREDVDYPVARRNRDERVAVDALIVVSRLKEMKTRDVDNLLKEVLDALQGTWSGVEKAAREGVIENDVQVFRATVEKIELEAVHRPYGTVTVRPFTR